MSFDSVFAKVEKYYTQKISAQGPTPAGVDWNSAESQTLRFDQLLRLIPAGEIFSINDYGCGYGALVDVLAARGTAFEYVGFELSNAMAAAAKRLHPESRFVTSLAALPVADYTLASGIFNVRLDIADDVWLEYICAQLKVLRSHSSKGFAFNILSSYSDIHRRRPDLYYADPLFFFDHCKQSISPKVALLHDYPLYEFTITVRL